MICRERSQRRKRNKKKREKKKKKKKKEEKRKKKSLAPKLFSFSKEKVRTRTLSFLLIS